MILLLGGIRRMFCRMLGVLGLGGGVCRLGGGILNSI